ncbi:hypothetical protein [uncultured Parolsenella sp.]|uniref:hypothetical protein n=1 Tax=uncultured Parolsenella sp. TaxID=2083008 RepID=UPI0025F4198B|nr:hypothetical protein [uncultured Parolsenella sp.]
MDVSGESLEKAKAELGDLAGAGVCMAGNAFSHVLLVKGEPEVADASGNVPALLAGPDGVALHKALGALGYAPEDWGALSVRDVDGFPLVPGTLRLAIATLDPSTLIALDEAAAAAIREAFADELVELESFDAAMLTPGAVVRLLGMRVMALGGFEKSLSDPKAKQLMWARLKQLPPEGEPY